MKLNQIKDNEGARKGRMRVGRGIGSGKGKTCGAGVKGQKARSGVAIGGYEGGQMPLYQRLPKRGFTNVQRKTYAELKLSDLQTAIDSKKLDSKKTIDEASLKTAGVLTHLRDGVRLIGTGTLTAKVDLVLSGATKSAVAAVEKAGGSFTVVVKSVANTEKKAGKKTEKKTSAAKAEKPKAETKTSKAKAPKKDA